MLKTTVLLAAGSLMIAASSAHASTLSEAAISFVGLQSAPAGGSASLEQRFGPNENDGLISFSASPGSLKAQGFVQLNESTGEFGSGYASYETIDLSFFQTTNTQTCQPNCISEIFVIFRMTATGSITQGVIPGAASANAEISISGSGLKDAAGNPITELVQKNSWASSFGSDVNVNEQFSLGFRAQLGSFYSAYAALGLSVAANCNFGVCGSVTADFGGTFEVDPYKVFELPEGYSASAPSMGLINNQIPALFTEPDGMPDVAPVPVPSSALLLGSGLALMASTFSYRRKRPNTRKYKPNSTG